MIRYGRRVRLLAAAMAALAGFVDALGFIVLGGSFVSFMSGNSTRLAVGAVQGYPNALIAAGLISSFVCGVVVGSLTGAAAGRRRRWAILALVAALLAGAAALSGFGLVGPATALMALAMGAENAVFEREGEVSIGVTYMTGTLVKLGQRIAGAVMGGDRWAWTPYLLLWLGLVGGAVAGAAIYPVLGLEALWIAAAVAACLGVVAARLGPDAEA